MKWFDVKRMKTTVGAILRELPRIAAIATGALVLAIAGNTMHPMNLPLLVTKGQPGVPNWVFERLKQVDTLACVARFSAFMMMGIGYLSASSKWTHREQWVLSMIQKCS